MTRVLQTILRLATLLIGLSATSVALAVATTVDVMPTGPQANETTIKLFDGNTEVLPGVQTRDLFKVKEPGTYTVEVYVGDKLIMVGGQRRQTITLAEGSNQLRVNSETGKVEVIPPVATPPRASMLGTPPSQFSIYVGPRVVRRNGVAFGVDPVTEQRLGLSPDNINAVGVDMTWRLSSGIQLSAGGMGGDRSNNAEVANGKKAGVAFQMPVGDIMGFSSNGGGKLNAKGKIFDLHLDSAFPSQVLKDEENSWWRSFLLVGGGYSETKDRGTFNVIADPDIRSTTDVKMKASYVHGGPELRGGHIFPNGLMGSVGIAASAIYYHASFDANQTFVCPVCSAAIQMVNGSASDSRNRLTFGALVSGALSYPVSDKASILLRLSYDEIWNAPRVLNKVSTNDPATHLGTGNLGIASAQLGVSIKF